MAGQGKMAQWGHTDKKQLHKQKIKQTKSNITLQVYSRVTNVRPTIILEVCVKSLNSRVRTPILF